MFIEDQLDIFRPEYNSKKVIEIIQKLDKFDWQFNQKEEKSEENELAEEEDIGSPECQVIRMTNLVEMEDGCLYEGQWDIA